MNTNKPLEGIYIYSDLDGTFLNGEGKVVEANFEAIERFKALGGHFAMSTGRSPITLGHAFQNYAEVCNTPIIVCNGACLYDHMNDKVVHGFVLDGKYMTELLRDVQAKWQGAKIHYYDTAFNFINLGEIPPVPELEFSWYKVVIIAEPEIVDEIRVYCEARCGELLTYNKSCATFFEMLNRDASKGKMIKWLRDDYRSRGEKFIAYAIGDYENDLEMIIESDIGAVPENGSPLVKAHADIITDSNNKGAIASLIGHILDEYNL